MIPISMSRRSWSRDGFCFAPMIPSSLHQRRSVVLVEDPRQFDLLHPVEQRVHPVFAVVGPLVVRERDVPQERYLVAVHLYGKLPVGPKDRDKNRAFFHGVPST